MRVRLVPGDSIMRFVWSRVGTAGREHERGEEEKKRRVNFQEAVNLCD